MQSDQRDITREARVDEEANELPDLAAVFGIRFANDVAHDGIVVKRRAKDVQGGDLVTTMKIAQGHGESVLSEIDIPFNRRGIPPANTTRALALLSQRMSGAALRLCGMQI
jgi:hypothetical protein